MHFTTIITMVAAIASTVSASPAKKPAPVAKVAPDSTLAVVVVGAISGWGYEQSATPVRVPFGKLTHFDKLPISSLEVRGVMVVGDGLPVPNDDKVRCRRYKDQYGLQLGSLEFKKGNPALISTGSVSFGWVLCRVEDGRLLEIATANGPSALPLFDVTPEKQAGILHFISAQLTVRPVPVTGVDLTGKTAIVTGSNCGIGLEISRQLLDLGLDKLIIAVRNEQKGENAATDLAAGRNPPLKDGTIEVWKFDLDSYDSFVSFGSRAKSLKRLDLVFFNAGIVLAKRAFNEQTKHDKIIQVNYLSTALLALSLLPAIAATRPNQLAPARMTFTLSEGAAWSRFKFNPNESILKALDAPAKDYDTTSHMMTSKLLGQFFVAELAKRVSSSLAIINSASPGAIHDSQFNREIDQTFAGAIFKRFQKYVANTSTIGAHMMADAALKHGEETHGQFLSFQKMVPMAPIPYKEEGKKIGEKLWQETMEELAFAKPEALLKAALN